MTTYRDPMSESEVEDERITFLQNQINSLRAELVRHPPLVEQGVIIEKDPTPSQQLRFQPTELPTYDGNRNHYPAWRQAVLDIFKMDWNAFGYTNTRAFLLIYMSLKGEAKTKAGAFYESGGIGGTRRPENFIDFLDRGNLDGTRTDKACDDLYNMKMGETQKWNSFFTSWASKLTEAEGDIWSDRTKITMLRNALNNTIRRALSGNHLLPRDNYAEWVRIVSQVSQQVEEVAHRGRRGFRREDFVNTNTTVRSQEQFIKHRSHYNEQQVPERFDAQGDVIMGGVNASHPGQDLSNQLRSNRAESERLPKSVKRRSKWKSPDTIRRLRTEGRCYRCERKGCNTRICPLLPAVNPKENVRVNVIEPIDECVYDELITDDQTDGSEN